MLLEVTADQIEQLNDTDLRELIGRLCEREVRDRQHSTSAVTWGGHQNAGDGGIDVRVSLPAGTALSGYIPKAATGIQVKAKKMPRSAILTEMAPKGILLSSIVELVADGGAYIIVSSKDSLSDTALKERKAAMTAAVGLLPPASSLTLDFYDRNRIATWVNLQVGLVAWVREKLGLPLSGWRPFGDWSSSPGPIDTPYLLDDSVRLIGPSIKSSDGIGAAKALGVLREILWKPKGVVRLVGLSGVGKTRLIQALFDERLGELALHQSDALYTDISDEPDPVPKEMLSRLVSQGQQVIMVVDNCGIGLHRKLVAKIMNSECMLSLITVEYDINDDEPENTDIFKLEPATTDLIENILENRYPAISAPSRHVIAKFSDGNSRVAFALANTAKNGESLANLRDEELFDRLFNQQKGQNKELFDAAKVCALLYSFDGETLEGDESELSPLATLAGLTVDQLHHHVAELHRRQLVQKRSKWRAILPHALAHRLAKRALADVHLMRIEDVIEKGKSERMLLSFSRRIGYLHDDEHAIILVKRWLGEDRMLSQLGKLTKLGEEILVNIAPIDPTAILTFIEKIAEKETWFFSAENINKIRIVEIIRSIAYDPALFERCVALLRRFVVNEVVGERDSTIDPLKSLFWLHLSGTNATAAQRAAFIKTLFESTVIADQELALTLLTAMLQTSHFASGYSFEFGAWKRDYGFHPTRGDQVRDWYFRSMEVGRIAGISGVATTARVRRLIATKIGQLLRTGMLEEVIALADDYLENGGWPEGWIAIQIAMKDKDKMPAAYFDMLNGLEQRLRPHDIAEMIRTYALSPEWSAIDVADLEDDAENDPIEAQERVYEVCTALGKKLGKNREQFNSLLPEIMSADSLKTFAIGKGIASSCSSIAEFWGHLKVEFLSKSAEKRKAQMISGFLKEAMVRAPHEAERFLDDALSDPHFHPYLVAWQIAAGLTNKGFERFMKMLAFDSVPISSFAYLAAGRAHEAFDDEQLRSLLHGIAARESGAKITARILGMRIFGRQSNKLPTSELIRTTAREFIMKVKLERGLFDHMMDQILEVSFDKSEHEDEARVFCVKILKAVKIHKVYVWELDRTIAALTKAFPLTVLDILLEQAMSGYGIESTILQDTRLNNASCPLDTVPVEIWTGWAALKPDSRYLYLAQAINFSNQDDKAGMSNWSAQAEKLIEVTPEPLKVLDIFLNRFGCQGRHNSPADALASRMPLIESLSKHSIPEVAMWAKNNIAGYVAKIQRQRAAEAAEDGARDSKFE